MSAALPMSHMSNQDTQEDQLRADCYRVMARLFAAAPDAALLDTLAKASTPATDTVGKAWNALCTLAARVGAGKTASGYLEALEREYSELFFGVGEPRVMLYGSWYQAGSLMDAPLARLRDDLAQLGFARDPDVREPEDHFAAVLEVMTMLVADRRPEQGEFFQRHLATWYAAVCQRLMAEDSEFYRAAAGFTRAVLDNEKELLAGC